MLTSHLRPFSTAFTNSSVLYRTAFAALLVASISANDAMALPTGGVVNGGSATITQTSPSSLVVNQASNRAIIDWRSFNINNGESTHFNQPSASAVALNRIHDGNPSQILGSLTATGKLVLVNPNGVFFGAGSRVDVSGLVASTADMSNADFMAGKTNFNIAGRADASIINKGTITAAEGGLVALVAPAVQNDGVIQARAGAVRIGSAETFTVDFYGDNLYSFALGSKTTKAGKDQDGNDLKSAVENNGTISAQGGTIVLTANAAKDIVTNAVNNTGVIEATSARMVNGTIVLGGGEGKVRVAGKLDASGNAAGEKGGNITVTGKDIALESATVDASGSIGGGTVKIGGDYQGGGDLQRAETVWVDERSLINVSALDNGNGGTAIVWSDLYTQFNGLIKANGGANGGNGGLVETSSQDILGVEGLVDATALLGQAGLWLLDPRNVLITSDSNSGVSGAPNYAPNTGSIFTPVRVNTGSITTALGAGTNVSVTTGLAGSLGSQDGNIWVQNDIVWSGAGSLLLTAFNNINIGRSALIFGAPTGVVLNGVTINSTGAGGVTMNAGNTITVDAALLGTASRIQTNSGAINLTAGNSIRLNAGTGGVGQINSTSGNITLTATSGDVNLGVGQVNGGSGVTTLKAGRDVLLGTTLVGGAKALSGTGNIFVDAARDIKLTSGVAGLSTIESTGGNVSLKAGRDTLLTGASSVKAGGDVTVDTARA